jgi:hypothetical protein
VAAFVAQNEALCCGVKQHFVHLSLLEQLGVEVWNGFFQKIKIPTGYMPSNYYFNINLIRA